MRPPNQRLSENFWLYECLVSRDHPQVAEKLNPSAYQIDCLKLLFESCWQPVRDKWGRIDMGSVFRSQELNLLVAGSDKSDHLIAAAGDGVPRKAWIWRVYRWIVRKNLPYRQCIWYKDRGFIHISVNVPGKRWKHEHWIDKAIYKDNR